MNAFLGFVPGSMGETSTTACLFGALVLVVTQVAMANDAGVVAGTFIMATMPHGVESDINNVLQFLRLAHRDWRRAVVWSLWRLTLYLRLSLIWANYYGLGIGVLVVLVRVVALLTQKV